MPFPKKVLMFTLFCLSVFSPFSQTDSLYLNSPYDAIKVHETKVDNWHKIDSTQIKPRENTLFTFANGKSTYEYNTYILDEEKGYRVNFVSFNEDLEGQRTLNAIRFFEKSKVVINGSITLLKSSIKDVKEVFGTPIKEYQPEMWNYKILWYHLNLKGWPCKVMFLFNLNETLISALICDINAPASSDNIYHLVAPND